MGDFYFSIVYLTSLVLVLYLLFRENARNIRHITSFKLVSRSKKSEFIKVLTHHHQYGLSVYLYTGADDLDGEQIADKLHIDYEPEKEEEWVSVDSFEITDIPVLDNSLI